MPARPAVTKLITVIASFDDVQQAAGRHGIRIVVYGPRAAEDVNRYAERVPKTGGDARNCLP